MSAFVLTLAAGMAMADRTSPVSSEVEQRLDLSGEWVGTWEGPDATPGQLTSGGGILIGHGDPRGLRVLDTTLATDEGGGRFSVAAGGQVFVGIYRWEGPHLVLCFCHVGRGRPTLFCSGPGQHLLRLRPVKPGK
jgi:hypothetical protein